jgi:DMSO/TMAO reductase YedYZ molybdopterin-dependent catalytic subunit
LQWGQGAVGNATWTGIPLKAVLEKAKVRNTAVDVVLEGADTGSVNTDPKSPGPITYSRSIPLAKANSPEVILATHMNGQPLTASHGFPIRAVVGGWYGMAAVKWLTRIHVSETPYNGFWQTLDYSYFERPHAGLPTLKPVTSMQPKAQIMRPALGDVVKAGSTVTMKGLAWAGERDVAKVEVSTDGGATWGVAKLLGDAVPFCWRHWEYTWAVPKTTGPAKLIAKATDTQGNTQPKDRNPDRRTYMINHWVPVDVEIG